MSDAIAIELVGPFAPGEQIAGEAEGQRRLADPALAADQPGMGQPSAGERTQQFGLGRFLPDQFGIGARRQDFRFLSLALMARSFAASWRDGV